jgi:hypothetical protein
VAAETRMTIAIPRAELVLALAPSLGEEKSSDVVTAALAKLGFEGAVLEPAQVDAVLDLLASERGLVGVAARVAKQRSRVFSDDPNLTSSGDSSSASRRSLWPRATDGRVYESSSSLRAPSMPPSAPTKVRVKDLTRMLAATLGDAKGEEIVRATLARLSLTEPEVTRDEALEVLEILAKEAGVVGVTARFAKARMLLKA